MPLKIKRTGLEQYAPGGDARIRMLAIGGPGTGKTRMSSYWPRPIAANCEAGLASVADRQMPYVDVANSRDMLEFLNDMQKVCRTPYRDREFQTVIIDTLDSFQRKVKDEYLLAHPEMQSFRGFDAYGYLEAKTQMLLTRLLNLDMNIIINVHYKDKTIREGTGENATERQELMLQLIGDVKDSIFNDFDLVGWLGTFWAPGPEGGDNRVEKRGLTFRRTPERPFLKDRLNVTPPWMEVTFSDSDYANLFAAVVERLDEIPQTEEVRDIEPLSAQQGGDTVTLVQGAVPAQSPAQVPLSALDKPTLQQKCREWGAKAEEFGRPDIGEKLKYKGNTVKSELVQMLEEVRPLLTQAAAEHRAKQEEAAKEGSTPDASPPQGDDPVASSATGEATSEAEAQPAQPTPAAVQETPVATAAPAATAEVQVESTPAQEVAPAPAPAQETPVVTVPAATVNGTEQVNPATGEIAPTTSEENVAHAAEALGADVVSSASQVEAPTEAPAPPAAPAPTPAPAPASAGGRQIPTHCRREGCETELAGENQDYVKISFVKFRTFLCNKDFTEAKAAGKLPWPLKSDDAAA